MKKLHLGFFALLCLAIANSSCRRSREITCSDGTIVVHPVGFTKSDFDSARVIRYRKDNTFSAALDSTTKTLYSNDAEHHDTAILHTYPASYPNSAEGFIVPGYDYRIILPASGRIFTITDITLSGQTHQTISSNTFEKVLHVCYNGVVHVAVDANVYTSTAGQPSISVEIVK